MASTNGVLTLPQSTTVRHDKAPDVRSIGHSRSSNIDVASRALGASRVQQPRFPEPTVLAAQAGCGLIGKHNPVRSLRIGRSGTVTDIDQRSSSERNIVAARIDALLGPIVSDK